MNSALRTTLSAVVGSLLLVGCNEVSETTTRDLPTSKFCELQARNESPSEDECEDLCADDGVDECSVLTKLPDPCTSETAKGDSTLIPSALVCTVTRLEFQSPFATRTYEGRRPEGFVPRTVAVEDLGTFFVSCHELEAASVDAFERLARELEAFGAPTSLVERTRRAKRDEIRHARWTASLAREHGSEPTTVAPAPLSIRSLFEMALENAVEGVVRETYGAACALYRAGRIADSRARDVMRRIAEDELRHAELSWDVATFAATHLDRDARRAIVQAIETTLDSLEDLGDDEPALRRAAGLPDQRASLRIVATIRDLVADAPFLHAA